MIQGLFQLHILGSILPVQILNPFLSLLQKVSYVNFQVKSSQNGCKLNLATKGIMSSEYILWQSTVSDVAWETTIRNDPLGIQILSPYLTSVALSPVFFFKAVSSTGCRGFASFNRWRDRAQGISCPTVVSLGSQHYETFALSIRLTICLFICHFNWQLDEIHSISVWRSLYTNFYILQIFWWL